MTNLLSNITGLFLTMGLPAIDESLDSLLQAMQDFPKEAFFGNTLSIAKSLGLILALCVGSYEAWMMMLGRRGMDIMKLFRIVGLSFCITFSGYICSSLATPGRYMEKAAKAMAKNMNTRVAMQEKAVAKLQKKYVERLTAVQDSLDKAKQVQKIGEDAGTFDKIIYTVQNLGDVIENNAKQLAVVAETKVSEWINDVIRFLGELIFQMSYYGMFVAQRAFMTILGIFCPISFALSIVPPWANAWSQWISKYLSLSLWGMVIYICVYYVDFILLYCLQKDITAYTALCGTIDNSWAQIGTLGLQGIGSTCLYAMGMLVGAYMLRFVPEVCSWLIPGGVSSSIGGAMGGIATAGVASAGGAAIGGAISGAAATSSVVSSVANTGASAVGGAVSGAQTGASMGAQATGGSVLGSLGGAFLGAGAGLVGGASEHIGSSISDSSTVNKLKDSYNKGKGKD